jgi:hypothetical protein
VAHGLQSLSCLAPDQDILEYPCCPWGGPPSSLWCDAEFPFHVAFSFFIIMGDGLPSGQPFPFPEKVMKTGFLQEGFSA